MYTVQKIKKRIKNNQWKMQNDKNIKISFIAEITKILECTFQGFSNENLYFIDNAVSVENTNFLISCSLCLFPYHKGILSQAKFTWHSPLLICSNVPRIAAWGR